MTKLMIWAITLVPIQCHAHFAWATFDRDNRRATVELAESPGADRIAWAEDIGARLDASVVIKGDSKDGVRSYPVRYSPGPFAVELVYGVVERGVEPFLLVYQARAASTLAEAAVIRGKGLEVTGVARADSWTVRILWNGRPDPTAELFTVDGTMVNVGKDGTAAVSFTSGAMTALRASRRTDGAGTWEGHSYGFTKTWSTVTWPEARPVTPGSDVDAYRSLQSASESRESISSAFRWTGSFEATDGRETLIGTLTANSSPKPVIAFEGSVSAESIEHVRAQLASLLMHRRSTPFAEGDGKSVVKWTGRSDDSGREVSVADRYGSTYRIKDGTVTEVVRTIDGKRLVLQVQSVERLPDGRYLSKRFTSTTSGPDGAVESQLVYEDRFTAVGNEWLPLERRVMGRSRGRDIKMSVRFSGYKVLP